MAAIENYNSSYPLAYYDVGSIYSFYSSLAMRGVPATDEQIRTYSPVLNDLMASEPSDPAAGIDNFWRPIGLARCYGVITEKRSIKKSPWITVMFCNKFNDHISYFTKKYAVGMEGGCATDEKNIMPTSFHFAFEPTERTVGGITLSEKSSAVGGITKSTAKEAPPSSVGGITKSSKSDDIPVEKKVGGITLSSEKVGGITKSE